jgi:nucleotide-binding universal stress UspA family protein
MRTPDIVVGVDGSAASWDALYWAVATARRRRASLHLVTVNFTSWPDDMSATGADPIPGGERRLADRLSKMLTEVRLLEPSVPTTAEVLRGVVAPVLCEAALHSRLLIVGNRGHGGFGRLPLGSTGHQIATHASIPVVVVRGHMGAADSPVVVGVDGSHGSEAALAVGFEEAKLRACPLIAVFAYGQAPNPWAQFGRPPDARLTHALAYSALDSAVEAWRDKYPQIDVDIATANAEAARVLADMSRHAQLVVVGAHGYGDSAGQLGSVPMRLLHRSHCPVLVAR